MDGRWFVIMCFYFEVVITFPSDVISNERGTFSHSMITYKGVLYATSKFLEQHGLQNKTQEIDKQIRDYFGTDRKAYQKYWLIIKTIIGHENLIQRDFVNVSFYHVNGEQIEIAHNYIRRIRQSIKSLSETATTDDIEMIREKVGAALYTIQEFYSNTNWIELRGKIVYEDFGQDNTTLVEVAGFEEDTCTNCEFQKQITLCDNNIVADKLTSGYKSAQDITKPVRQGKRGKCSHGTKDDDSRFIAATGGIYKGRSVQNEAPRSFLHRAAYKAAIMATEYFLVGPDRGLLSLIGEEVFRDVFSIRTREDVVKTSLTFVIDVTGSMGDDINAVIKATRKTVTEAKESTLLPGNYILVTFSDPASLTTGRKTTDPQTMLTWLQNLEADGGDDCPEYALTGMLKGIEMSDKNSKIYVFTDADAKDEELRDQVVTGLRVKSLTPVFLLTGQCSTKRKRDIYEQSHVPEGFGNKTSRMKRSSLKIFEAIAKETGGKVVETKVTELGNIVEEEIKGTFPSSNVFVTWFVIPARTMSNENITIPVDNNIQSLKIVVNNVTTESEFTLSCPDGTNVMFSSEKEQLNIFDNILTISIQDPEFGIWELQRNKLSAYVVNVTAQSPVDFLTSILEPSADGNFFQLSGNPIKGQSYLLVVDIQNLNSNSSCTSVGLLDNNGDEVTNISVTRVDMVDIARCIGNFVPFNASDYVQIRGTDEHGNEFLRTNMFSIIPVSVKLRIFPILGNIRLNEGNNISFSLTNTGSKSLQFIITAVLVRKNNNNNVSTWLGSLDAGHVYNADVIVTPTSLNPIHLEFSVTLENYTGIVQKETRRYSVIDTRTARCTVLNVPEMCPTESLNTRNCSIYEWKGLVQVSSATIRLSEIRVSTDEVVLDHLNLSEANFSLQISVSGHCCVQSFVLTITDNDGYFDQCNFVLSTKPMYIVQNTTEEEIDTAIIGGKKVEVGVNWKLIGIITGSTIAGIFLITLLFVIIYRTKKKAGSYQIVLDLMPWQKKKIVEE